MNVQLLMIICETFKSRNDNFLKFVSANLIDNPLSLFSRKRVLITSDLTFARSLNSCKHKSELFSIHFVIEKLTDSSDFNPSILKDNL